jgi:holo-[acyl-carrier protein] synthase
MSEALRALASTLVVEAGAAAPLGIGVDVEEIASFEALPFDAHQHFYARVFTDDEIRYCLTYAAPAEHFAARFAAKEAVVKACGSLHTIAPPQVEIGRLPSGAPFVRLHPADALDPSVSLYVSLGHSQSLAYAVAIAVTYSARASGPSSHQDISSTAGTSTCTVSQPDGSVS